MTSELFVQQDQPPGVPPMVLTGERTLPDVPAENYWFQRHLAVYEWIGARVLGARVCDLACGEGYGSAVLARGAASVVGVDANPEAFEHARLRYRSDNLRFERGAVETHGGVGEDAVYDAVVFLQTIEHVQDPAAVLTHMRSLLTTGGTVYVTTPNLLTIAPAGAEKSDNPWHIREYRAAEFQELCRSVFGQVQVLGLYHARRLALHALALRWGWDAVHARLGITRSFYDWFTPSITARDFALREGDLDSALDFLAICRT
ncbi:MAG TPA: methyltransferase domain-containing protein [Solirubrobacteraceae bacterium]|nr:methyltransferase domain-containing protein [Solirubrobacteraceae bacterium]